jgi:hypothetical protein
MVFMISAEFRVPMEDVTELALGAERAVFEKPENPGVRMKPLFIQGQLDGTPVGHMLVDGGASINVEGCHTPFRERGNEASIHVPRMFKSHTW